VKEYRDPDHKYQTNVAWLGSEANTLVTASAQGKVVLYTKEADGSFTRGRVITHGHSDNVRGVVADPQGGFLTFSNDGTARQFNARGDFKAKFEVNVRNGKAEVCYAVAVLPDGNVVGGGEGQPFACKVFTREGKESQTMPLAAQLLCLGVFPNGDILTGVGGSSSMVRVWSRDPSRQLPAEAAAKLLASPAAKTASAPEPKKPPVPVENEAALQTPGATDKATKHIRSSDGKVWVYVWDENEYQWDRVGLAEEAKKTAGSFPYKCDVCNQPCDPAAHLQVIYATHTYICAHHGHIQYIFTDIHTYVLYLNLWGVNMVHGTAPQLRSATRLLITKKGLT